MRTRAWLSFAALCLLCLAACENTRTVDAPTQVTVRVTSTDDELRSSLTQLRVSAALRDGDGWRSPAVNHFPRQGLKWPVDVPVFPRTAADSSKQFEVVVEALLNDVVLAEARAVTSFAPGRRLVLELLLFRCPGREPGEVCASQGCRGTECMVCDPSGACVPFVAVDPATLPALSNASGSEPDAGGTDSGGLDSGGMDGSAADAQLDAAVADAPSAEGSAPSDAQPDAPSRSECDDTHPCSMGYACTQGSCVSACAATKCDPNASCSLNAGVPVCTCGNGFVSIPGDAGGVTCARDVACDELGCDTNATCEVGSNQVRRCVCKPGYTGSGTSCAPVSCPTLVAPTNGSVSRTQGSFGQTATYGCDLGYDLSAALTRSCEANGKWSGGATDPTCAPKSCGALGNPSHGVVQIQGGAPTYGAVARYSCDTNYTRFGAETRQCQSTGTWSGSPATCLGCGDGIISTAELGEACDPKAPPWTIWTCNPQTCQRATLYRPCDANDDVSGGGKQGRGCAGGVLCWAFCSPTCTKAEDCPAPPPGSSLVPLCGVSIPICILSGCTTSADCPPGLICGDSGTGTKICGWCSDSSPCPNQQSCSPTTGNAFTGNCPRVLPP